MRLPNGNGKTKIPQNTGHKPRKQKRRPPPTTIVRPRSEMDSVLIDGQPFNYDRIAFSPFQMPTGDWRP